MSGNSSSLNTSSTNSEYKPLHNVCEFLSALHVYADDARKGITRFVEANHYCSHVRKDLRQCLIYDSHKKDARLIGVEYMVPKHVYLTFADDEKKLWHSHEFEVKSGMLVLPKPSNMEQADWEEAELEAMKEIVGLYGKTWHFWQIDRGDEFPLGMPTLMGSFTNKNQIDMEQSLSQRNKIHQVHHGDKARKRESIIVPDIHHHANSWWHEQTSSS